jgi:hypothetical protein
MAPIMIQMIARNPDKHPRPKAEKADQSGIPNPTQATKNAAKTP